MSNVIFLKSLQALELAIRSGSLVTAAGRLGITPAAVGQRIRTLEDHLGVELLVRGRSGLQPTRELEQALDDLQSAFAALQRVADTLEFQRISEIQIVANLDWTDLWLEPRMAAFRHAHPNIRFCINGTGDAPVRLGVPDIRITMDDSSGEALFTDIVLPVTGPDIVRRIAGRQPVRQMEGMPLLHLKAQSQSPDLPGWVEWFQNFGHRSDGQDRGVRFQHARQGLEAARQNVGFLLCSYSMARGDLESGRVFNPFPVSQHLRAPHPYRMAVRQQSMSRPQVQQFVDWLRNEARETREALAVTTGQVDDRL